MNLSPVSVAAFWSELEKLGGEVVPDGVTLGRYDKKYAEGLQGFNLAHVRKGDKMFTIRVDGKRAGVLGYAPSASDDKIGFLKVVVAPEYRGQGVYRAALRAARPKFPPQLLATVALGNKKSRAVHEHLGFKEVSEKRLETLRKFGRLQQNQTRYTAPREKKAAAQALPRLLYHGSPDDVDQLTSPTKERGIFLTVAPGLAAPFIISREDVGRHNGVVRFGQHAWRQPASAVQKVPTKVRVRHDSENTPIKKGVTKGYIYVVDSRSLRGKAVPSPDEPREIVYHGTKLDYVRKIPVSLHWVSKYHDGLKARSGTKTPDRVKTAALSPAAVKAFWGDLDEIEKTALGLGGMWTGLKLLGSKASLGLPGKMIQSAAGSMHLGPTAAATAAFAPVIGKGVEKMTLQASKKAARVGLRGAAPVNTLTPTQAGLQRASVKLREAAPGIGSATERTVSFAS